jgi:hypothetical protein
MPYRYAGCIKPRQKRHAGKLLEWSLMGLLMLDVLLQILAISPVDGVYFWLADFGCDFVMFIVIYLIITMRA